MKSARDAIAKIEDMLTSEIETAALKRDLNKMVTALTESVKHLVHIAKEMADSLEGLIDPVTPPKPAPAKKAAPKRAKKPATAKVAAKPVTKG